MADVKLQVRLREERGGKLARAMRAAGDIPGVRLRRGCSGSGVGQVFEAVELLLPDGLDVRHLGAVSDVSATPEDGRVAIVAQAESDVWGELDAAMEKSDLFERAYGVRVTFDAIEAEVRA